MNPINDFKKKVETKSKGGVVKKALTRKCSIAAVSHIRSHYHISSKIQLFW